MQCLLCTDGTVKSLKVCGLLWLHILSLAMVFRSSNGESPIFVNTSLHGVSDQFITRAAEIFGFPPFKPVTQQQQPDPEFPTVTFPNPEEKGMFRSSYFSLHPNMPQELWYFRSNVTRDR